MKLKPTFIHYYLSQGVADLKSLPYLYLDLIKKLMEKWSFGKTMSSLCAAKATVCVSLYVWERVSVYKYATKFKKLCIFF